MSVFILKLIAVCSMLADHTAFFLFRKYHIVHAVYVLLRGVGRLAFPIYSFLIVNGFSRTADRGKYLSRLTLFALISELPYSLLTSGENYQRSALAGISTHYALIPTLAVAVFVCLVWYFTVRRDISALLPAALLFGTVRLGIGGIYILNYSMNVFYTLALGLACICLIDSAFSRKDKPAYVLALRALAICAAMLVIRGNADYGYEGLALIIGLYLCRGSRRSLAVYLTAWSLFKYIPSAEIVVYTFSSLLSVIPIYYYNGSLGKKMQTAFYYVYPAHLFLLGLLTFL